MPVTPTYVALGTITLASTDSEIVFSSIPATYRDLIIVIVGKGTADTPLRMQFNSDTGSNYTFVYMSGGSDGGTYSGSGTNAHIDSFIVSANTCITTHRIMDYSATDKHKSVLSVRDLAGNDVMRWAHRWANTSAISSMRIFTPSASLAIGTQLSLYGIAG